MAVRSMVWIEGLNAGWSCSNCYWKFPVPTLLTGKEARDAYDRLASAKFGDHDCKEYSALPVQSSMSGFTERARTLIMRGYKPKIAVEIVLHELEFEHRNNPEALAKARGDAEEFLARIRKGLI
jgi:hypothetical protein